MSVLSIASDQADPTYETVAMSMTPLIGDILMLSQLAWKIGCAFTAGRKGAPAQFAEVEQELQSLAATVTLLADTLHEDDSLLAGSDEKTRDGLTKILGCCSQSLSNLEAFVKQYQEVRKSDEAGGITQRSWKTVLIKNYKTIIWTTEGGNIQSLRNMLALHTQSLSLAMQALQTYASSSLRKFPNDKLTWWQSIAFSTRGHYRASRQSDREHKREAQW